MSEFQPNYSPPGSHGPGTVPAQPAFGPSAYVPQQYGPPPGGPGGPAGPNPFGSPGPFGPGYRQPENGIGTAALVLGILALLLGLIPIAFLFTYVLGPLAVIFGIIGISKANKQLATNRGAAIAGLVLGVLGLIAAVIWTAAWASAANDVVKSLPRTTVSTGTGGSSTNAGPTNLPLGQAVTATSGGNTTQVVVVRQQRNDGTLGMLVTYSCSTGSCAYNEFDWKLRAEDGTTYGVTLADNFGPVLNSGTLNKGDKAQGWVAFSAPAGIYKAEYTGDLFSTPATWQLP